MSLDRVPAGKDVPDDCNVIIEIPKDAAMPRTLITILPLFSPE